MDRKSERKWRMRQLRLRSTIFFRRNGLYMAVFAFLAVIGVAAALIFAEPSGSPTPVHRSDDEKLADVVSNSPESGTFAPQASLQPQRTPQQTIIGGSPLPVPGGTPLILPNDNSTPLPDFTFSPEQTADPMLSKLQPPVDGSVIRIFAMNSLIYSETLNQWMTHSGVDIAARKGDKVYCVLAGTVENVYSDDMLGVTVVIKHENGLFSVYANLKDAPPVAIGESIAARQVIGYIGDTALSECAEPSHLHFELHYNGVPIDPQELIVFKKP